MLQAQKPAPPRHAPAERTAAPEPAPQASPGALGLSLAARPGGPVVPRRCARCAAADELERRTGTPQPRCPECEAGEGGGILRRRAEGGPAAAAPGDAVRDLAGAAGGRPLNPSTRAFFEAGFGRGFGGVRVHTGPQADASARAVSALAYTVGRDIVFRDGRFSPGSHEGRRLLAHELAHVAQQEEGGAVRPGAAPDGALAVGSARDPLEREADAAADAVLARRPPVPLTPDAGGALRRQDLATSSSITDAYARGLTPGERGHELAAVVERIQALPAGDPEQEALAANLDVLVEAAVEAGDLPSAPFPLPLSGGLFAAPEETEPVASRVNLLLAMIAGLLPRTPDATVRRLDVRLAWLPWLRSGRVEAETARADAAMATLDLVARLDGVVPAEPPEDPVLGGAVSDLRAAMDAALAALYTPGEAEAAVRVDQARSAYLDVLTGTFIYSAQELRSALPAAPSADRYGAFLHGFAQYGTIVWSATVDHWATYLDQLASVRTDLAAMGDLPALASAPLEERLAFLDAQGEQLQELIQRARACVLVQAGFDVGDTLLSAVIDDWAQQPRDLFLARDIRDRVVAPLTAPLAGGAPPEAALAAGQQALTDALQRTEQRLAELAEFHRRMDWFIAIASTVVGIRAMTWAGAALGRTALLRPAAGAGVRAAAGNAGRGLLRFTLSSLAFTGASVTTRALLTGRAPTAGQVGTQAAMDLATLGLLRGTQLAVGLRYGGVAQAPPAVLHGTTFAVLWAWSTGITLYNARGELSAERVASIAGETGVRTAVDLAVIVWANGLFEMPRVGGTGAGNALGRTAEAEWNELQAQGRAAARELRRWREGAERDLAELDGLLREAVRVVQAARGIYGRMAEGGVLTAEQRTALDAQAEQAAQGLFNFRDVARLGIEPVGESAYSYRGPAESVGVFLARLVRQGIARSVRPANRPGIFEVEMSDGSIQFLFPEGVSPRTTVVDADLAAEGMERVAPDVPPDVRSTALVHLRGRPAPEFAEVIGALEANPMPEVVRWLAGRSVGDALAARPSPFDSAFILRMMRDPALGSAVLGNRGSAIQAWFEAWSELAAGAGGTRSFPEFLLAVQEYRGTLDVADAAGARSAAQAFAQSAPAFPLDPYAERSYISAEGGERAPYLDTGQYLARNGLTAGELLHGYPGGVEWVVQLIDGVPTRAWRFPRSGYPPDLEVALAAPLRRVRAGVELARVQAATDPAAARATLELLRPYVRELAPLRMLRTPRLADAHRLLAEAETGLAGTGGGGGPLALPAHLAAADLGLPASLEVRDAPGYRQFTYRFAGTGALVKQLRDQGAWIDRPADDARGLRTVIGRFGEDPPLVFLERPDPVYGKVESGLLEEDPGLQRLLDELGVTSPAARTAAARMLAQERNSQAMPGALKQLRRRLRAIQDEEARRGSSLDARLARLYSEGIIVSAEDPALVARARALAASGFLDTPEWRSQRDEGEFAGVLAEALAPPLAAGLGPPGSTVLRSVYFMGDGFLTPDGNEPFLMEGRRPMVDGVVMELDLMVVTETPARVEVHAVANVKAPTGLQGDASSQNAIALEALRGHIERRRARVTTRKRETYYAEVKSIHGVEAGTGRTVTLTRRVAEKAGGPDARTIGPAGSEEYHLQLPLTYPQIQKLVRILREMDLIRRQGR